MKTDQRGNPVSYDSQQAIDALDQTCDLLHAYQADPLAAVDRIVAEHPDFAMAHAFRAGMLATATDKAFEPELIKRVAAAEALLPKANDRERMHISAARAWLDGDWERAVERWGRASINYPHDLLALQLAHVGDFLLGYSQLLCDRVARVLPHWSRDVPGYGFVEGMYAFGLEEAGRLCAGRSARRRAQRSLRTGPTDGHRTAGSRSTCDGTWRCFTSMRMTRQPRCGCLTRRFLLRVLVKRLNLLTERLCCGGCHCSATTSATAGAT